MVAKWSLDNTHDLGATLPAEANKFTFFQEEPSVGDAVQKLNKEKIKCAEGICIIKSEKQGNYFVLCTPEKQQEVKVLFVEPATSLISPTEYPKLLPTIQDKMPASVRPYVMMAVQALMQVLCWLLTAWPYVVRFTSIAEAFVEMIPEHVGVAIMGFLLCFFGGMFPLCIAAFEAWHLAGGKEAVAELGVLLGEVDKLRLANEADNKKDEDHNGIPDVQKISGEALVLRKCHLVVKACDPQRVSAAISGLNLGWIGVLATLKIKFVKLITLGASIGDHLYVIASKYCEPALKQALPNEYEKCVAGAIWYGCRAAAISIAWWIQRVISGFHSALLGGHMFACAMLKLLVKSGLLESFDEKTSRMDHYGGWAVAVVGFLFQWQCGFSIPTLFSLVLWPAQILEGYIRWQVA